MITKVYFISALVTCLMVSSCHASTSEKPLKSKVETNTEIENSCCKVSLAEGISKEKIKVSGVRLGVSKEEVQRVLGSPSKTESYDNELSNDVHTLLYYNKSYFEFKADELVSFEINDSNFKLECFDLVVGADLSKCENLSKEKSNKVRVQVKNQDEAILIELDPNRKIKSIYYWVNW